MKFKSFIALLIVAGFEIFDATDMILLQDFMKTNLLDRGNPPPSPSPTPSSSREDHAPTDSGKNSTLMGKARHRICPGEVTISWQLRPPYTLEKNASKDRTEVTGIFHKALNFALETCCEFYWGKKPIMRYLSMSENSSALHRTAFTEDTVSLAFPIQRDWYTRGRKGRRYINILDSPGVVLIRRGPSNTVEIRSQLFKAILGTWPIVVLSLLMSSLAGICIWMLVSLP